MARWTVTFETAVIARGTAPTTEEATTAARTEHDVRVALGLNPDALAYHVFPEDNYTTTAETLCKLLGISIPEETP